jgi:membrane-associated phospholipid phosphatase
MNKRNQKNLLTALGLLVAFVLWTLAIRYLDVRPIGPDCSEVGFAGINGWFHNLTEVHWGLYTLTDWLGLVPLCFVLGFALLGLVQIVTRKSLFKVDGDILVLGGFYVLVMAGYVLFEIFSINYRPVLINGILEASYPSSTTLLVLCVMPTAMMQFHSRIQNRLLRKSINFVIAAFTVFMVMGRLISGVHWLTDIIGGILLSMALVMLYYAICGCLRNGEVNSASGY